VAAEHVLPSRAAATFSEWSTIPGPLLHYPFPRLITCEHRQIGTQAANPLFCSVRNLPSLTFRPLHIPNLWVNEILCNRHCGNWWLENYQGFGTVGVFLAEVLSAEFETTDPPEKANPSHSPFEQHSCRYMFWCKRGISCLYVGFPCEGECGW